MANVVVLVPGDVDRGCEVTHWRDLETKDVYTLHGVLECPLGPGASLALEGGDGYLLCLEGRVAVDMRADHAGVVDLAPGRFVRVRKGDFAVESA